jgi:carboxymethylenebutenolidase
LLAKIGVKYEIKTFPGTEHGFAFPERPVYSTLAAEETWHKMFAMWERRVKRG